MENQVNVTKEVANRLTNAGNSRWGCKSDDQLEEGKSQKVYIYFQSPLRQLLFSILTTSHRRTISQVQGYWARKDFGELHNLTLDK